MRSETPTYEMLMEQSDIVFISELDEYRYVKLKASAPYENCIWCVNKKTKAVTRMNFVDYLCDVDRAATYVFATPEWKH